MGRYVYIIYTKSKSSINRTIGFGQLKAVISALVAMKSLTSVLPTGRSLKRSIV